MPATDAFVLFNMIAAEYGLRTRLGSREWCTGLTGAGDDYVRTVLPFTGSAANGAQNKIFAVTSSGIWDVTTSSASPSSVLSFGITSGRAGHGVSTVHVTAGGHFLLYADEANGLHVYSESSGAWAAIVPTATVIWAALTAYVAGDYRLNDSGKTYVCTTSGTSAGSGGPTGTGTGIADGSAVWSYVAGVVSGVDPATFAFVMVFKGRVWAIPQNTADLWYSAAGSIYGAYTKFTLSTKLKAGGPLIGAWSWTYDGGSGLDDSLVAVSKGGDVVIYQGTDPASASTFGITGVWNVGDLPEGRELATDYGGELLLLTRTGILPLSKLVRGGSASPGEYATAKISNLFNAAMLSKATTAGWTMRLHPEENALMVTVPEAEGTATTQLMMSLSTQGWSRYRDLPIYSSGVFGGQMYFGTVDGKVCINDGYVDGRPLSDPTEYTPVHYSGIGAFLNLGNGRQKQVQIIRPYFMGQSTAPSFEVAAKYDFDINELAPVSPVAGSGSVWDSAVWDTATWGGDYSASNAVRGATGMGVNVAMAWRGVAVDRTILIRFDVGFTQGGML
jgi:hypothetical protein